MYCSMQYRWPLRCDLLDLKKARALVPGIVENLYISTAQFIYSDDCLTVRHRCFFSPIQRKP